MRDSIPAFFPASRAKFARVRLSDRFVALLAILATLALTARMSDVPLHAFTPMVVAPPPPVSDDELDAELAVSVVGPNDQPIASAKVRALWERDGRYYLAGSGVTDGSGKVLLARLPRGPTWLIAEADGFARSSTQLVLDGGTRAAEVSLGVAHELRVTVTDESNVVLPGATVLVTTGDPLPFGALSGIDGVARFSRLSEAPWTVKASAAGYESVTQSGVTADVTLSLRRLASIRVVVLGGHGAPVPGASVFIGGPVLWPARVAETGPDGSARISGLLAGSYDLKAQKGSLVSDTILGHSLERGADDEITLHLFAGRMVTAWVTDDDEDHPSSVSDADVVLVEGGLSSFPIRGRTGADGRVTLGPIADGPATIAAGANEYVSRSAIAVPDKLDGPVQIPLLRGGTLEGEVVDAKDRPVDGASIEVIGTDLDGLPIAENPALSAFRRSHFEWSLGGPSPLIPAGELGVMPGPIPPIPGAAFDLGAIEPLVGSTNEEIVPWVTRFDGTFRAHPVTPGRIRALVRHPAYVEGVSEAVTLAPGGTAKVKVVLLAGGTLEGRVVDGSGRGVSGARVDLTATRGTFERTTFTATDGTFAFAAVPAEVTIGVARPDDLSRIVVRTTVEVEEGGKKSVEIVLPGLREAIRVAVTDDSNRPVEAAEVRVLSVDPNAPLRQTLFTDADGAVTVADARGLDLRIVVDAIGWAIQAKSVEKAGEKIAIELSRGVIVVGKVTVVRGRRTLEGASVTLVSEGRRASALTDADGVFRVKDVAPGPIHLIASHPEYANGEADAVVTSTGRADRPFELPPIDLAEPGSIQGEVLDPSGKPVRGARVAAGIVPAYLPAGALPSGMVVTDAKGRFTLTGLSPGQVEVEAYAVDVGRGVARVNVSVGRPTTGVSVRLVKMASQDDPTISGSVAVTLGERGSGDDLDVVIVQVAAGSEAERAGLRARDVIWAVDGVDVSSMGNARARLSGPAGSDVVVEVERGGSMVKLRVGREAVRR